MKKFFPLLFAMAFTALGNIDSITSITLLTASTHINCGDTVILQKSIFVDSLLTLTVDSGVVFKASPNAGIVVLRGGKLAAVGTAAHPVIFTSIEDNMGSIPNICDSCLLPDSGLWNGITILGRAPVKTSVYVPKSYSALSNILAPYGWSQRAAFGGPDSLDSSGILQYVSIRYAGTNYVNMSTPLSEGSSLPSKLEDAMGEFNGLGLFGVGSKTKLDHVEVFKGNDVGFKFVGGTVRGKYLLAAFNLAEGFNMLAGYNGMGQYWCAYSFYWKSSHQKVTGEGKPCLFWINTEPEASDSVNTRPLFSNISLIGENRYSGLMPSIDISANCSFRNYYSYPTFSNSVIFDAGRLAWTPSGIVNSQGFLLTSLVWRQTSFANNAGEWYSGANPDLEVDWGKKKNLNVNLSVQDFLVHNEVILSKYDTTVIGPDHYLFDPRVRDLYKKGIGIYKIDSVDSWFDHTDYVGAFAPRHYAAFLDQMDSIKNAPKKYDDTASTNLRRSWIAKWTGLYQQGYIAQYTDTFPPPPVGLYNYSLVNAALKPTMILCGKTLRVFIGKPCDHLRLEAYSLTGRRIKSMHFSKMGAGEHSFPTASLRLGNGSYIIRVAADNEAITSKQTIISQ